MGTIIISSNIAASTNLLGALRGDCRQLAALLFSCSQLM